MFLTYLIVTLACSGVLAKEQLHCFGTDCHGHEICRMSLVNGHISGFCSDGHCDPRHQCNNIGLQADHHCCCLDQHCIEATRAASSVSGNNILTTAQVSCPICDHKGCHGSRVCADHESCLFIKHDHSQSHCAPVHECNHGPDHTCCTTYACIQGMINFNGHGSSVQTHVTCPLCHENVCSGSQTCTDAEPSCLFTMHGDVIQDSRCVAGHDCHGPEHHCCMNHMCVEGLMKLHNNVLACPKCDSFPHHCEHQKKFCHNEEACMFFTQHGQNHTDCKHVDECTHPHHDVQVLQCCTDQQCIESDIYQITTTAAPTTTQAATTAQASSNVQATTASLSNLKSPCSECTDYVGHVCNNTSAICPEDCVIQNINGKVSTSCMQTAQCQNLVSAQPGNVKCCNDLQCYADSLMNTIAGVNLGISLTCPECSDLLTGNCVADETCHSDEVCMIQSSGGKLRTGCTRNTMCDLESLDPSMTTDCCKTSSCRNITIGKYLTPVTTTRAATTQLTSTTLAPTTTTVAPTTAAPASSTVTINFQNPSVVVTQGPGQTTKAPCVDNEDPNLSCQTMNMIWGVCTATSGQTYDLAITRCRKTCNLC